MQVEPKLHFRLARIEDIPAMSAIRLSVRENILRDPSKVTLAMYRDYLTTSGQGWVCECNQTIIGFSYAAIADHSIWALFVDPQHEGLGAGKQLLRLACNWLFEQGAGEVKLSTTPNTRADRFYQTQGWRRQEVPGLNEVLFTLRTYAN